MIKSLNKAQKNRFQSLKFSTIVIILTAIIFGLSEHYIEENWIEISLSYISEQPNLIAAIIISFYLLPLFCHYILDGYIWKGSHREAKVIYEV